MFHLSVEWREEGESKRKLKGGRREGEEGGRVREEGGREGGGREEGGREGGEEGEKGGRVRR